MKGEAYHIFNNANSLKTTLTTNPQQGLPENVIPMACERLVRSRTFRLLTSLGVLTKADTVQEGDHAQWIKILNNESHILRRGYYVTRLPGPTTAEANQSWEQARDNEHKFLKKKPWSLSDKNRLGIEKLTEALSIGLATMIEEKSLCSSLF